MATMLRLLAAGSRAGYTQRASVRPLIKSQWIREALRHSHGGMGASSAHSPRFAARAWVSSASNLASRGMGTVPLCLRSGFIR